MCQFLLGTGTTITDQSADHVSSYVSCQFLLGTVQLLDRESHYLQTGLDLEVLNLVSIPLRYGTTFFQISEIYSMLVCVNSS